MFVNYNSGFIMKVVGILGVGIRKEVWIEDGSYWYIDFVCVYIYIIIYVIYIIYK